MSVSERSISRGRGAFSTGRGGVGNIRQPSQSTDARSESGPDDFSVTRGREPIASQKEIFSTGRGGAGNIRSPSRDIQDPITNRFEQDVMKEYKKSQEGALVSSGRGGLGNIHRSRSRDLASNPIYSTSRSGFVADDRYVQVASLNGDELNNIHALQEKKPFSYPTDRGGNSNTIYMHEPAVGQSPHFGDEYQSTGHSGAGNIVKETS
jgi:hypothetical protein